MLLQLPPTFTSTLTGSTMTMTTTTMRIVASCVGLSISTTKMSSKKSFRTNVVGDACLGAKKSTANGTTT